MFNFQTILNESVEKFHQTARIFYCLTAIIFIVPNRKHALPSPSFNVQPANSSPSGCLSGWCDIVIMENRKGKGKDKYTFMACKYYPLMCPCAVICKTVCLVDAVDNMSKSRTSFA